MSIRVGRVIQILTVLTVVWGTLFVGNKWNSSRCCGCPHLASAPASSVTQQNILCRNIASSRVPEPSGKSFVYCFYKWQAGSGVNCHEGKQRTANTARPQIVCSIKRDNMRVSGVQRGVAFLVACTARHLES